MDSWQKDVYKKLEGFIGHSPGEIIDGEVAGKIYINRPEAYVLLVIIEEWQRLRNPLMEAKSDGSIVPANCQERSVGTV